MPTRQIENSKHDCHRLHCIWVPHTMESRANKNIGFELVVFGHIQLDKIDKSDLRSPNSQIQFRYTPNTLPIKAFMSLHGGPWRSPRKSVETPWRSPWRSVEAHGDLVKSPWSLHGVPDYVGHRHGDHPLLRPTGTPIATKSLPGPTNREHRELIGVKTISLGTSYSLYCLECCQYFRI